MNNDTDLNNSTKSFSSDINNVASSSEKENVKPQTDKEEFMAPTGENKSGFDLIKRDGKIEVYFIGNHQSRCRIYRTRQSEPNNGFEPWREIYRDPLESVQYPYPPIYPAVGIDSANKIYMAAVTTTGTKYRLNIYSEIAENDMKLLKAYPETAYSGHDVKMARNKNGKLELFYVSGNGYLYHAVQDNHLKWPDSLKVFSEGFWNSSPAIAMDRKKNLNLFVIKGPNLWRRLWTLRQNDDTTWPIPNPDPAQWKWRDLEAGVEGRGLTGNPAVGVNKNGRIDVFVSGIGEDLQSITQNNDGTWPRFPADEWYSLGGRIFTDPGVGRNQDGRLEIFVLGTGGNIYHIYQTAPNNDYTGYSGWGKFIKRHDKSYLDDFVYHYRGRDIHTSISLPPKEGKIRLINNADGRFSAFAFGDVLYHAYQTSPSNGWNDYPWKRMWKHFSWPPV